MMQVILAVRPGQAKRLSFKHPKALVVDADRRMLWSNGLWLKLGATRFAVVFAIALRRGGLMSKPELGDLLWSGREDGGPDTQWKIIDIHLCALRKLLPSLGVTVLTVHGQGYRLIEAAAPPEIEIRRAA
jgi:DNA-binding response OmpR family regulator